MRSYSPATSHNAGLSPGRKASGALHGVYLRRLEEARDDPVALAAFRINTAASFYAQGPEAHRIATRFLRAMKAASQVRQLPTAKAAPNTRKLSELIDGIVGREAPMEVRAAARLAGVAATATLLIDIGQIRTPDYDSWHRAAHRVAKTLAAQFARGPEGSR